MRNVIEKPVKFSKPVVVIPADEYEQLLKEAGYIETPKLDKDVTNARKRFKKGKFINWEKLKGELI